MKRKLYPKPSNEDSFATLSATKFNYITSAALLLRSNITFIHYILIVVIIYN